MNLNKLFSYFNSSHCLVNSNLIQVKKTRSEAGKCIRFTETTWWQSTKLSFHCANYLRPSSNCFDTVSLVPFFVIIIWLFINSNWKTSEGHSHKSYIEKNMNDANLSDIQVNRCISYRDDRLVGRMNVGQIIGIKLLHVAQLVQYE